MAEIIITIPNNKATEFKLGFLKEQPVPVDENGDPTMTEMEWAAYWGRKQYIEAYKRGKLKLASEGHGIDPEILG